jgi:hypothetical protein
MAYTRKTKWRRKRPPFLLRCVHRLVLKRARRRAANEIRDFDKVASILPACPAETRGLLRVVIRKLRTAREYIGQTSLAMGIILVFICVYVSREVDRWTPIRLHGLVDWFPAGWVAMWLALGVVAIVDWTREGKIASFFMNSSAVLDPIVFAIAAEVALSRKSIPAEIVAGLALGGTFFVYLFLAYSALFTYVVNLVQKWSGAGPDIVATYRCFLLLTALVSEGHRWNELAWRRQIALRIEVIAQAIERCGLWMRRIGDENSAAWIQHRMAAVAAGVREKKKWLAMPRLDTREQLVLAIAEAFIALVNCNWDALPYGESASLSRREKLRIGLVRLRGVLLSISIPAVLFWAVQYSPFAFKPPVRDYAAGFLLLWILVVLLSAADPLYQNRIEAFRNVVQIFPFAKKEN